LFVGRIVGIAVSSGKSSSWQYEIRPLGNPGAAVGRRGSGRSCSALLVSRTGQGFDVLRADRDPISRSARLAGPLATDPSPVLN
jgi:hypothetical protein